MNDEGGSTNRKMADPPVKDKGRRCAIWIPLALLFNGLLPASVFSQPAHGAALVWGINAIALKSPLPESTTMETFPGHRQQVVWLNRFYRAGGQGLPTAPTECGIGYTHKALFVAFRCAESNLSFPATRHNANWYAMVSSPPEQDSAFPDEVHLFIQPDLARRDYDEFAVTLDGRKFGCRRNDEPDQSGEEAGRGSRATKLAGFDAVVVRGTNEWNVFFRIPWKILGGKPKSRFGLLPMRTRWRNGEVSSPVAFDFTDRPPRDLFIETEFADSAPVGNPDTSLCTLPSGALRWQRPALLSYPDSQTVDQIWKMESSLGQPTDPSNFSRRLFLIQRWIDLLTLEGFNFRAGIGSVALPGMQPTPVRREINAVLRRGDLPHACRLLDGFLRKLDRTSRDWFADGSPGDILKQEWIPVSKVQRVEVRNHVLFLLTEAGGRRLELHLCLPKTGGVRIYGNAQGYFKPGGLLPLNLVQSSNSCSISTASGTIVVSRIPFEIDFRDAAGKPVTRIGPGDLAFRFDAAGRILAVDLKSQLEPDEVIYGFGERYDHFNQRGRILTLWGIDDWFGNTVGLMNQTYKPIALFHSSRGYTVFDNSTYRLRADIGKTRAGQCRLTQQGPIFDDYFWIGPPETALESYTDLTGKPLLPPRWAFGPWIGRTGRGWSHNDSRNPVVIEEKVVRHFEALDIPHSAIYAEGSSADSPELNRFMAGHGLKVLSWYYPAISLARQAELMPDLNTNLPPLLHAQTGDVPWPLVDFTNPNALELCRRWWERRLELGVAGSMVDFGDRVPEDAVFFNGKRGDEMHNFYAYDYQRTYSEVFREKRGDDFILIGRAAAPGTQRWVGQFAGDHPANFAGLRAVLTGALNLSACGFSTWGSDLGGFLGWPEPAVYIRWTQFACFSPLMRSHGRTPREPWHYGPAAVANYKRCAWIRENLLDYIYHAAVDAHLTGIPIMRSLAVAFPDQPALAAVKDEYMFGKDLLVAPVVSGKNSRTILFPPGRWTDLWTGGSVRGPISLATAVPLETIPVYLREGAALPVRLDKKLRFGESMTGGSVRALVVTPPGPHQFVTWRSTAADPITARLRPLAGGFAVTLRHYSDIRALLVYGATVKAVRIGGTPLPRVPETDFATAPMTWCMDSKHAVVRLPATAIPVGRAYPRAGSMNQHPRPTRLAGTPAPPAGENSTQSTADDSAREIELDLATQGHAK